MKKICYSGVGWGGRQRCKGPFGKLSYQICPSCTCSVVLFRPRANTVFQIEVKSYPLHHHFPEHMGLVLGFGAPPSFCHQLYVTTLFSEHPKPDLPSYLMDHHSHILNSGLHSLQDLLAITSPLSKLFMLPPKGFFFFSIQLLVFIPASSVWAPISSVTNSSLFPPFMLLCRLLELF